MLKEVDGSFTDCNVSFVSREEKGMKKRWNERTRDAVWITYLVSSGPKILLRARKLVDTESPIEDHFYFEREFKWNNP